MLSNRSRVVLACAAAAFLLMGRPAAAQMDNSPYSFKGGASVGLSNAARQAIINEKLTGETPRNLLRGPGDQLLSVEEGPGGTAIVTGPGGEVLPQYRGRPTFRRDLGREVGVFNNFFRGAGGSDLGNTFFAGGIGTRVSIASWTGMVMGDGGGGTVPAGPSPVDSWTSQVFQYF